MTAAATAVTTIEHAHRAPGLAALERAFPDWTAATAWLKAPRGEIGGREPRALLLQGRCDVFLGMPSVLVFARPSSSEPGGRPVPKLEPLQAAGSTRARILR